jgi:hypothetical protein
MLKCIENISDNNNNWSNYIDVIYYINLDHRSDRDQLFLQEMSRMNVPKDKIVRISGVYKKNQGNLGCSASHIIALTKFQESSFNNCIIFEDDFEFTKNLNPINKAFEEFFTNIIDWNVCCLSANIIYQENIGYKYINKITNTQTTSGYMVNKKYNNVLLENYKEGYDLLLKSYDKGKSDQIQGPYCLDQYWKKLQHNNWFVFNPKLGKQRNSDSDIQGGFVIMEVFTDFFL